MRPPIPLSILHPRLPALLLACLLLTATAAPGAEPERIKRGGYLLVNLEPQMETSQLQGTSHMENIHEHFGRQSQTLGETLAAGLEESAVQGRFLVLAGHDEAATEGFRAVGEPDAFLVTVDMVNRSGFNENSWLGALIATGSCFTLSSWNLFRFENRTEARLRVYYFTPAGERKGLLERRYRAEAARKGDFYDANNMRKEADWLYHLTEKNVAELGRQILAELPNELRQRSRKQLAAFLERPPVGGRLRINNPPQPNLAKAAPPESGTTADLQAPPAPSLSAKPANLQDLIRLAGPSVFKVRTDKSTGSGFVLSRQGHGLTSLHVVEEAADITVVFHNGDELTAEVAGADAELDLALLRFDGGGLRPLALADSDRLAVGDELVAVGYPRNFGLTVVPGTVVSLQPFRGVPLIRLDAALANGNSGGPLLTAEGKAIGINFRKIDDGRQTATFGLPINLARKAFANTFDPADPFASP